MCQFKSGIILKNRVVLAPMYNDSHSALLRGLGIEDSYHNATRTFVRAELVPVDDDKTTNPKDWKYIVDQDIVPEWYESDPERYEQEFRAAVEEWVDKNMVVILGRSWKVIKRDEKGTYYLLNDILEESEFGRINNYAESYIRKNLNEGSLAQELRAEFGDKLIPINSDLLSLDGLKDYGSVDGDILAILTLDLYRECRENIPNADSWWWLATPDSTPSGYGTDCVQYVYSNGIVDYHGYRYDEGVRPFFILKS
jgi:hypothetical protein